MKKEYFIGIVPPEEYMERIEHFQRKWMNHLGVEPHITIKAQWGLALDKEWIDKVKEVCENFKAFQLSLDKPLYFGDNILYLIVNSNDLIKKYFELDDFVPHLTLGKEQYGGNVSTGMTKQELKYMENFVEKEFTPYPSFEVTYIRISELNREKQRYEKSLNVSLSI